MLNHPEFNAVFTGLRKNHAVEFSNKNLPDGVTARVDLREYKNGSSRFASYAYYSENQTKFTTAREASKYQQAWKLWKQRKGPKPSTVRIGMDIITVLPTV